MPVSNLSEEQIKEKFTKACDCHQQGLEQEALQLYNELLLSFPKAFLLNYNIGLLYYEINDFSQAKKHYLIAQQEYPNSHDLLYNLGLCQKKSGEIEEAKKSFLEALQCEGDDIDCLYNLAGCYRETEELEHAKLCYEAVLSRDKNYLPALSNLAYTCQRMGDKKEALGYYQRVLEIEPQHQGALHMVATITGVHFNHTSSQYVEELFDNYAESFDESLIEKLHYQVPQLIKRELLEVVPETTKFNHLLDIGCGTGLTGLVLKDMARAMTGVDLSHKMLAKALEKNIYHHLIPADIEKFASQTDQEYDLIVAADVFSYIGNLQEAFGQIDEMAAPGALLVFSMERHENENEIAPLQLGTTGRFTHSLEYITTLAREHKMTILRQTEVTLREEAASSIQGWLFVFKTA
ncbi:tetratricopeptide repeat protein [Desulfotalea psychrophila]|uniref:Uncharacterized protein n=1 Tax=Desulfotalea psychrophila (strain LSv54 / DSM 12343) TaxID=177439 RepID=Q6AK56_DESPS|nr:tetratricopeptide repeat protein [Desulfotalea psychrophila]CAG37270.1 conserved hypothetical protein [Desulfotalea psychrophila LSv54]